MNSSPLSGGTAPLVFSMVTRQSGTMSDWEGSSHVPSMSAPPAKDSLSSVTSACSNVSEGDSEHPPFGDEVILVLGPTRRIATYGCWSATAPLTALRI